VLVTFTGMTSSVARHHHPSSQLSRSLDADSFKALFRGHPGGVAVITADAGNGPVALTATSVSSVSAEPPQLVFSVSTLSSASPTFVRASTVIVHLLDADDLDVAKLGATSGIDRFADPLTWTRLATGEPVYHGVRAWVRCAVIDRMDAGGSTIIAAHALQSSIRPSSSADGADEHSNALVYHNRTWHRLGRHSELA
jgi:flavin reductase (DIM6/NTAB) family NADH-FMN oxidoreductase RutF